jgi:hypothetical protein
MPRLRTIIVATSWVAGLAGLASFLLPWWTIHVSFGKAGEFSAKPFQPGQFADRRQVLEGTGLDMETLLTGLIASLAIAAIAAHVLVEARGGKRPAPPPFVTVALPLVAFLAGLGALLYTFFAWPAGEGDGYSFFDHRDVGGGSVVAYGDVGWFLALGAIGFLPLVIVILAVIRKQTEAASSDGSPKTSRRE